MKLLSRKPNSKIRDTHVRFTDEEYALLDRCAAVESRPFSALVRLYAVRWAREWIKRKGK